MPAGVHPVLFAAATNDMKSQFFQESILAHRYLDGLTGLEIGESAHNAFGLNTRNVDFTDSLDTVFKRAEIEFCGVAARVDIVAGGDSLPLPDKSVDFVISSHVIEHFFDPIKALLEWARVARKYIFVICPQRDALPCDAKLPVTPLGELWERHHGILPSPEIDTHAHYTRWTCESFVLMCSSLGMHVVESQDPDDKVGNGFSVVIDLMP